MNYSSDSSKAFQWATLIFSTVTIVYLAAAAVRENVTADWRRYQKEYGRILAAKRGTVAEFPIEIRQVTVPALKAVDRCVSCHNGIDDPRMAGQRNPHKTHPKGLLQIHRVERFGCTICHQGQGAALTFEEAKAEEYFWDYPLLPAALTEATCNSCHNPRALPAGAAAKLVRGMKLYAQLGCGGCHKLDGKGGPLGPALDNVGLKTKHQFVRANLKGAQTVWNWLDQHFRDP
ncbi:MAG: c-type cytochrome, partial [Acidobacteria bacterium]|nr:c-type cytochrome [Acidobacteriota bacterium]